MKRLFLICTILLLIASCRSAGADDAKSPIPVYDTEDMLAIAGNPAGSYALMCDIDMSGVEWPAITFTGKFDGKGFAILNLNTVAVSEETRVTYDGNRKTYDTHFAGLFAIAENATVKNVRLIGLNIYPGSGNGAGGPVYDGDCFLGGIAGFASETTIENCEVTGMIRLDVDNGRMFGVGGVIGYGNAVIRNCTVDTTLVNTDLDKKNRDEQYLGGICGAGYPDIEGCTINIAGYISDHGYVHSGGMVGMYIIYPKRFDRDGFVRNNTLKGFITFFEDNTNRRAYCVKDFGEVMDHKFKESDNTFDFKRDERKDYSVNLVPEMCENPVYDDVAVAPGSCGTHGYTEHTCRTCGYTYRDAYTLPTHTLSETYETVTESTLDSHGLGEFTCTVCGAKVREELPLLTPTPMPTPTPTPIPDPTITGSQKTPDRSGNSSEDKTDDGGSLLIPILCGVLLVVGIVLLAQIIRHRRERRRKLKRLRRNKARRSSDGNPQRPLT